MQNKKFFALVFFLNFVWVFPINSFAQTYGNEWINPLQTYLKIKIGKEGIYRINRNVLQSFGIDVNNINPKNIQIFREGKEIPIYIEGESDGRLDPQDFIEFFGYANDGMLDRELYVSPNQQPSTYYSLYSDTAIYYLTWNTSNNNQRLVNYQNTDFVGKTPDDFFIYEALETYHRDFYPGIPNNNDGMQLYSEYTMGEGFHRSVWSGRFSTDIATPALSSFGPLPTIEVLAFSTNHNLSTIVNNANHEFGVAVKNANNPIGTQRGLGHDRFFINRNVDRAFIDPVTRVWMGEMTFANSGFVVNYCKIRYPRNLDLANNVNLKVNYKFNSEYLRFINYPAGKNAPIVYDFTNQNRIFPAKSGNEIEFNLKNNNLSNLFIYDESDITEITIPFCSIAEMNVVIPTTQTNYIILSNLKLATGANDYKKYRESIQGGGYQVEIVYVHDLYEQYSYGVEHPLALRRYLAQLKQSRPSIQHILLLGKGQSYVRIRKNNALREAYNLVPTIGHPASDMLLVSPLDASSLKTNFSIGRIPARDNKQIQIYLDKIQSFETSNQEMWRKKVVQLAGGSTTSETQLYVNYLNNYFNIISDTSLGGNRVLFTKQDPIGIDESLTSSIIKELNDGASVLSYFGHGAAQVTEISLGEPSQYNNFGKTPLFIFNGCALGNTFEDLSLGEQFLFEPNKGAVGWLASTNFGFDHTLYGQTLQFHIELFQTHYGQEVGKALHESLNNWGRTSNVLERLQARQWVYHGDPALRLFQSEFPDYFISQANINLNSGFVDSVALQFEIANNGKATRQKLPLLIKATNSSNNNLYSKSLTIDAPFNSAKHSVRVPSQNMRGLINFNIQIDSAQIIVEQMPQGKSNNAYQFSEVFQNLAPGILSPMYDAIVSVRNPEIVIQIPQFSLEEKKVTIEWDTTPHFSSILGREDLTTNQHLIRRSISLNAGNKMDYYVRVKYQIQNTISEWSYTTFGLLEGESPGWTEGNKWKFYNTEKQQIELDTQSNVFSFQRTNSRQYKIVTNGDGNGRFNERYIVIDGSPAIINWWPVRGVALMFINPDTDIRYSETSNQFNLAFPTPWWPPGEPSEFTVVGNPSGVYHYNTDNLVHQDSMIALLKRIPSGYHMIMMSLFNSNPSLWSENLWTTLEDYGISRLKRVGLGEPFGVYATKGGNFPAVEYMGDYENLVSPPIKQRLEVAELFSPSLTNGTLKSKIIGPGTNWSEVTYSFKEFDSEQDTLISRIYGSNNRTQWNIVKTDTNLFSIDISNIDASIYPYLYFETFLKNIKTRQAPDISRWTINYQSPSDGAINYDLAFQFESDTVPQGRDVILALGFTNVKNNELDSTTCLIYVRDHNNTIDTIGIQNVPALKSWEGFVISDTIKTHLKTGDYGIFVVFNPDKNPKEISYENNVFFRSVHVLADQKHPLMDVVFDGKPIMNEDIVSPNTLITISLLDDNPYMVLDNPDLIRATLKLPDGRIDSLHHFSDQLWFYPSSKAGEKAVLEYQAKDLPSGIYTLSVNAMDQAGNWSGGKPYMISFKVIRESSISNIYPYPNPFTTATKFVFTLTGDRVPDFIKIQIMTVAGKVVREVTQSELGPIRIGHNISEFTWDGTDEFGDPLGNGVYFYKVTAKLDGKEMDAFEGEDGSAFFKNGIGKMYLMR